MADDYEKLIYQIIVESSDSINKILAFRQAVDAMKGAIALSAIETKASFKDIGKILADSIKSLKPEDVVKKLEGLNISGLSSLGDPLKNADESQRLLAQATIVASQELTKEAVSTEKAAIAMGKLSDATQQQKILDQQMAAAKKGTETGVQEKIAANQQLVALTKEQAKAEQDTQAQATQAARQAAQEKMAANKQYVELYKANAKQIEEAEKKAQKEAEKTQQAAKNGINVFQSIGRAIQIAFGIGTYQLIMKVVQALQQAMKAGYDFAKATYQLALGINALRRAGVDITLKDMYDSLDRLQKKFGIFSKVELVEGAAAFANLVRDMGFTKEQIFELQDAVSTLAIVNGRAMDDVQRTVALALSSGYTEGLQRLGVSINRVNIALKAEELGYGRVYMTLTEAQRAEATQILILEKTAKYANDVATYQETLAGSIDRANSKIKDQTAVMGEDLLVVQRWWAEIKSHLIAVFADFIGIAEPFITVVSDMTHAMVRSEEVAKEQGKSLLDLKTLLEEGAKAWLRWGNSMYMATHAGKNLPNLEKLLGKEGIEKLYGRQTPAEAAIEAQQKAAQESADRIMDFMTKMAKEQLDLEKERDADILKARDKFWKDMEKLEEENASKVADIQKKYQDTVDKIGAGLSKDIADARRKAGKDTAQANRDFNNKLAESNAKYRENQIKAEIDYQERLRKLREGFLMDLEDALHERDARQILRLIRQYNLQRTQAKREYDINLDEMKRAHALELEELAKQRAERLREIQAELQDKITAIQAEAAIRLAEAAKERDAELTEQAAKYEEEKTARQAAFNQEIEDVKQKFQDRLTEIAKSLADEYKLTEAELGKIAKLYAGLNDYAARAARAAGDYVRTLLARVAQIQALVAPLYGMVDKAKNWNFQVNQVAGTTTTPVPGKPRAKGGIDFATQPTNLTIGEAGTPEVAFTMPLTKAFSGNQFLNGNPISGLSSNKSNLDIALLLSPDLEARIVRESGDHVANVLMEVQRNK